MIKIKIPYNHYNHEDEKCFVETHTIAGSGTNLTGNIPLNILVSPNTVDQLVFKDYTNNHNKTLLQLSSTPFSPFPALPLTIIIRTRGPENPIIATLPVDRQGNLGGPVVFEVEDFESLTVSNTHMDQTGQLSAFIQKTFCICCENSKKKCNF